MSERSTKETAALIVGHGTREPEGTYGFLELVSSVQKQFRSYVQPAFLSIASPSILEGAEHCLSAGADRLLVIPLFLFGGQDVKKKLPQALDEVRVKHPQVAITLLPHIGWDRRIFEILKERLQSVTPPGSFSGTAVLLVARGFSDQDAMAEMREICARFAEAADLRIVRHAFVEIASPSIPEGVQACLDFQPKKIVVLPYLLFPGLMQKKIRYQLELARLHKAGGTPIQIAGCLGPHPKLTELLIERIQKGL